MSQRQNTQRRNVHRQWQQKNKIELTLKTTVKMFLEATRPRQNELRMSQRQKNSTPRVQRPMSPPLSAVGFKTPKAKQRPVVELPNASQKHIKILPQEQELFQLLLDTVKRFRLDCTVRIAGGWVRDKLMGVTCSDIDVVLDTMTGVRFCHKLNVLLKERNPGTQPKFFVVRINPDKSKHLETGLMKLFGFELNFVHLRSETYASDSRIPLIKIGTPLEDAFRRDLTINSLFYNLNTDTIEDFTGLGLHDIENKIIRTPMLPLPSSEHSLATKVAVESILKFLPNEMTQQLNPEKTLREDPLRVLRVIRFASRFGWKIDPSVTEIMKREDVSDWILNLVSPERIGYELAHMLKQSAQCMLHSLELITEFNLPHLFFNFRYEGMSPVWTENERSLALLRASHALRVLQKHDPFPYGPEYVLVAYISAVDPLRYRLKGFNPIYHCFKRLGLLADVTKNICRLFDSMSDFTEIFNGSIDSQIKDTPNGDVKVWYSKVYTERLRSDDKARNDIGFWIQSTGPIWPHIVHLSRICQLNENHRTQSDKDADGVYTKEEAFIDAVKATQLDRVSTLKPLLTGTEIMELLQIPPSPLVGGYLYFLMCWQFTHLDADKQAAEQYLKSLAAQCGGADKLDKFYTWHKIPQQNN
jgi:tRNA nucleotidyltransferase/poly(A) polymerase